MGKGTKAFNNTGWGRPGRTVRIGVAIGQDANKDVLAQFTGNEETVFEANNAQRLADLIKWASVTLSKYASSGASQIDPTPGSGPRLCHLHHQCLKKMNTMIWNCGNESV